MTSTAIYQGQGLSPAGMRRLLAGIALSLLVHSALVYAPRPRSAPALLQQPKPQLPLVVRLAPPPPPPPVALAPEPETPPPARSKAAPAAAPRQPRVKPAKPVIALPDSTPGTPEPAEKFTATPAPAQDGPVFDPDAARKFARRIAKDPDPADPDSLHARLPKKQLETENAAARGIAGAHRRNCKDGLPGGLLAPLILLFDKKDSGCKW